MGWTDQLSALLEHCWNGGFNRSSEHHEGASWYGISVKEKVHPALSPVEKWEKATKKDEAFGVSVPWKDVGLTVGELIECMLKEQRGARSIAMSSAARQTKSPGLVSRFMNFVQKRTAKSAAKAKKMA